MATAKTIKAKPAKARAPAKAATKRAAKPAPKLARKPKPVPDAATARSIAAKKAIAPRAPAAPGAERPLAHSLKGAVLGRPRMDREKLQQIQTRVPSNLTDYLKMLSLAPLPDQPSPFRTLQAMFEALFERFVEERPWERGFPWRETRSVARFSAGEVAERTMWRQLNIWLSTGLAERVKSAAKAADRSEASFAYTALCWWADYLYPPVAPR